MRLAVDDTTAADSHMTGTASVAFAPVAGAGETLEAAMTTMHLPEHPYTQDEVVAELVRATYLLFAQLHRA